ncbi:quinate permease [Colletotrichum graminicola]|nr:quinate permease [Colletotrichum graminicola]
MLKNWQWGTYIFFAVFLGGSIVWVWFCLPETKGVTLEEMDRVFGSNTAAEDTILLEQARRDVGLTEDLEDNAIQSEKKSLGESQLESA